jgi:hypothetical protein
MNVKPYFPEKITSVNRSYSALSCALSRHLNRFVWAPYNHFCFIPNRPFFYFFLKRRTRNIFYRVMTGIVRRMSLQWFLEEVVERIYYKSPDILGESRRQKILDLHKTSNRQLTDICGVDLEKYGYY